MVTEGREPHIRPPKAPPKAMSAILNAPSLSPSSVPSKPALVGMSRAELGDALGTVGVPEGQRKMRVAQLWHWLYVRGATDFDAMTNVAKDLRARLAGQFVIGRPEIVTEQISEDGTRK